MAIKKYYDSDCNLGVLDGKTVAVIGFGSRGYCERQNHPSGNLWRFRGHRLRHRFSITNRHDLRFPDRPSQRALFSRNGHYGSH